MCVCVAMVLLAKGDWQRSKVGDAHFSWLPADENGQDVMCSK